MNTIIIYTFRFFLFLVMQIFVFDHLELGFGIYFLIYPLFIMTLPFETSLFLLLIISFVFGSLLDIFSNTYGIHTSSLLLFAYLRPLIFKLMIPNESNDPGKTPSIYSLGHFWFFATFGILLGIYLFYFFLLESFSYHNLFYIIQKTVMSFLFIYVSSILVQLLMFKRVRN